jgi:RNA polymerase sigma factor (TIGR02999 family)
MLHPLTTMGRGAVLSEFEAVDTHSAQFAALYEELHRIADRELRRSGGVVVSATTLLHEAYFRVQQQSGTALSNQKQFLAYAARVMRNLIIDFARRNLAQKRGGGFEITQLPIAVPEQAADAAELERVGVAIDALEAIDPELAQLVNLRFFCGLTFVEIAALRDVSKRTVQRDWDKARLLLQRALQGRDLLNP